MANFNPLGYTGKVPASLTRLGVCQFNPVDFTVSEDGVVSLGGTGAVQTINSLLPTAGNIVIAGTAAQVSVANAGSTITLSLPAAITAPGSLATTTTLAAGTSLSAGTTITATLGAITATNGNLVLNTAGNGVRIKEGANARIGRGAVLVGGTLAVANTSVTANTVIIPVITALGTVAAPQALYVTKNAGVGFTVTSADVTDTSTFDWYLVEAV